MSRSPVSSRSTVVAWLSCFAIVVTPTLAAETADWPWWRGPSRNGVAAPDQTPPLTWSESENVVWKTPIPGRGFGSPTAVGTRVFLATADEAKQTRSVICFDRQTGRELWTTEVHRGKPVLPKNDKGTQASSTIACDGERCYVNFLHDDAMFTSALSVEGDLLWQRRISDYVEHQGFGSSPALFESTVIVASDNKAGGAIAGLKAETGEIVWRHDRPATPNYPSPIILEVAGRTQVLMTGCELVAGFDPVSGEKLWERAGATTECVTSTATDGVHIYSTGGYPKNHVAAYRVDAGGEVAWENGTRIYVPSMLIADGYLYAVADAGVAICWNAATGEELWKSRIGGTFSSSPVLVGERIYATDESGKTTVFRASSKAFEKLGESDLGDECFATPAICGSRIYTRVAIVRDGKRQEFLYCLGER